VTARLGPFERRAKVEPNGAYEIVGLPPGTYEVEAVARVGGKAAAARTAVGAGGTADLVLR
jgi:hypothetical protein